MKALLANHSIPWEEVVVAKDASETENSRQAESQLSPSEKVALFRCLFRGRTDVYPMRWKSAKGKSGSSLLNRY